MSGSGTGAGKAQKGNPAWLVPTMVTLMVVIIGAVSLSRLRIDLLPNIELPTVTVRTEYEGATLRENLTFGLAWQPIPQTILKVDYVDADNAAGGPGAITAALFLKHFTAGLPWAHLDIASVGDSPVDSFEWTSGATGFGARALLHWLELREPLAGITS